jgi:hypothetical protein
MACCGQNRATLKGNYQAPGPLPERPVKHATTSRVVAAAGATLVRYVNGGHVLVRGPRTGWQYEFSATSSVQAVEPHDAESFLATGMFERVREH